ncbi:MAG: peptide chain release factor N(5)-glutamine methyltransferase [Flavobacterium sp.]|nr:peptide chain release factor N(5)-glutamine methyltransferase [Pedobacter sp.]
MTILEIEKIFINELTNLYVFEEARNLAWLSIGNECGLTKIEYVTSKNKELSELQKTSLINILKQLKTGKPFQYIVGETEFYGHTIKVNDSVLIPRPETEELVDWVIKDKDIKSRHNGKLRILDIGTGSGCIAIALKKSLPNYLISGIDISDTAIATAIENADINNQVISFYEDDIFSLKNSQLTEGLFDIIVSNPPYVTKSEMKDMHQNILNFEPHTSLFVDDEDPLKFYQGIADYAQHHLVSGGKIYFEINECFYLEVMELLRRNNFFNIELRYDLSNKPRMVKAEKIEI